MAGSLRIRLEDGWYGVPLARVHRVAGFAALAGEPDEYFLGWLTFQGKQAPVFDLNRVMCEKATPEQFGTRIVLIEMGPDASVPYVGLLAAGVTDTCRADEPGVTPLDVDLYLQMLANFIPTPPKAA